MQTNACLHFCGLRPLWHLVKIGVKFMLLETCAGAIEVLAIQRVHKNQEYAWYRLPKQAWCKVQKTNKNKASHVDHYEMV